MPARASRSTTLITAIPAAIALNLGMATLVNLLKLPVFLDSTGTAVMGALFGPWVGIATGVASNLIAGLVINPVYPAFVVTAAFVGCAAGLAGRAGWFERPLHAVLAGAATGVVAACLSAPVATVVFNGVTPAGSYSLMVAFAKASGQTLLKSTLLAGFASDPVDKAITFGLVFLVLRALPSAVRHRFGAQRSRHAAEMGPGSRA